MKVQVEIQGFMRKPAGKAKLELEVPEGATADDVVAALGYRPQERLAIKVGRGKDVLTPAAPVCEGDALTLFTAVGGG